MMLDCGDRWRGNRFSLHLFRETIDLLGLMNLDEDLQFKTDKVLLESLPVAGPLTLYLPKTEA